jgi:hypothetical protein
MTVHDVRRDTPPQASAEEQELQALWQRVVGRRSFLKQAGLIGAAAVPASALAASAASAKSDRPTDGDIAILRFLAAAEILETDLWEQYNELGGLQGGNPAYVRRSRTSIPTRRPTSPETRVTSTATPTSSTPTWFPKARSR